MSFNVFEKMDALTSIGLVLWTLVSLGLTLNVIHPLMNRDKAKPLNLLLGFGLGWIIGELAPQWILLNMGGFLLLQIFSDLEPIVFFGLLGIHSILWLSLIIRLWLILNLPQRLEEQMQNQLGQFFLKTSTRNPPPQSFAQVDWKSLWLPASIFNNPEIEVEFNRKFEAEPGLKLQLDLYRPRESGKNRPMLIQIHGGGWVIGSRRQGAFLLSRMASRGWVCCSIDYRFSPEIRMPEHLIDCKRALKWIRSHAQDLEIDPDAVFVTGGSAGSHLALMMALTANHPKFQPGFEEVNTRIQGWVGFYGAFDMHSAFENHHRENARRKLLEVVMGGTPDTHPEVFRLSSPFQWSSREIPPGMMLQGGHDTLIPMEEAVQMQLYLQKQAEEKQVLLKVPLAQHGFDIFPSITAQCVVPFVERYLVKQYQKLQQKRNDEH